MSLRRTPALRRLSPEAPGRPRSSSRAYGYRLSFCCDRDGCRKRVTPPSVRFLGRKVYLGAVVILVAAMRQGPSPRRVRELSSLFGVDRRTIARWQVFWRRTLSADTVLEDRTRSPGAGGRDRRPAAVARGSLPHAATITAGAGSAAPVSLADHDRRRPGDRGLPHEFRSARRRCSLDRSRRPYVVDGHTSLSPNLSRKL